MPGNRVHLVLLPFFIAGIVIHLLLPVGLVPELWMGIVAGAVLLLGAVLIAVVCDRCGQWRLPGAWLAAYLGLSLTANSLWPLALLLPAIAVAVKWRAVAIQTGHRPPGD